MLICVTRLYLLVSYAFRVYSEEGQQAMGLVSFRSLAGIATARPRVGVDSSVGVLLDLVDLSELARRNGDLEHADRLLLAALATHNCYG